MKPNLPLSLFGFPPPELVKICPLLCLRINGGVSERAEDVRSDVREIK